MFGLPYTFAEPYRYSAQQRASLPLSETTQAGDDQNPKE